MTSFAIIPAAGRSRRMGQPKLLLPWKEGQTVIDATLQAWRNSAIQEIVVVARADDHALQDRCHQYDVHLVLPIAGPPHMKDSVVAGLSWIQQHFTTDENDVWLIAPADSPRLSPHVVNRLLAEHDPSVPLILKPAYEGRHGHPVLFPWSLASAAMLLPENQGIDALTGSHAVRVVECDEPSILDELNTPDDYDLLREST